MNTRSCLNLIPAYGQACETFPAFRIRMRCFENATAWKRLVRRAMLALADTPTSQATAEHKDEHEHDCKIGRRNLPRKVQFLIQ